MFYTFPWACSRIRRSLYGIKAFSQLNQGYTATTGTGFMIAPGVLVTPAHVVHIQGDRTKSRYTNFQAILASDVGKKMESCTYIGEDLVRDIALIRIEKPRSKKVVSFYLNKIPIGTTCGSLGFPLSSIHPNTGVFNLFERFQGASISGYQNTILVDQNFYSYETDALMYPGASGSPGFLRNGKVFGMHNASIVQRRVVEQTLNQSEPNKGDIFRVAISIWVPIKDIIDFAKSKGIKI
ncbi:MAG: serine protease [Patescibacteria group bacterium]